MENCTNSNSLGISRKPIVFSSSLRLNIKQIAFLLLALFSSNFAKSQNLSYTTNWLGNSGALNSVYVQEEIHNMWVSPEGTSYTNTWWDEEHHQIGVYSSSGAIQPYLSNIPYGSEVGGNSTAVFAADGTTLGRYLRSGGTQSATVVVTGTAIMGIAANDTEVFVSSLNGRIYVYNATTLAAVRNFTVGGSGRLALDGAGFLWAITGSTSLKRYSNTGVLQSQSITLPSGNIAAAVTVNTANNTLYVIDRGTDQNVKVYNNVTTSPIRTTDFGVVGGMLSGPTPGLVGPLRFTFNAINDLDVNGHIFGQCGIGTDNSGNIYIQHGTQSGANIEKYTSSGTMQWRLIGHTFEEGAYIDPTTDETDIYAGAHHYKMNYGAAADTEMASWYAVVNGVNESNAYNAIERGVSFAGMTPIRITNIAGSKFMYMQGQTGHIYVYRMQSNSETLVNCGITDDTSPAWRKGSFNDVDANGSIWSGDNLSIIEKYPCTGVSNGIPTYNLSSPITTPIPAPYTSGFVGVKYIAETDVMYLTGNTTGTSYSKLSRYNNWSTSRTLVYTVDLFFSGSGTDIMSMDVAGDYIFTDYFGGGRTAYSDPGFGLVKVWNANTGAFVRDLKTPLNYHAGDSDNIGNTRAYKRSNGEYIITFLDHLTNKTVVFRWNPGGGTTTVAPTVSTSAISAITSTSASCGGNVTADGGASVTARGVCWSTTANPTTANSKTSDGSGIGIFTSSITGLTAGTTYNVRAYATNSVGTSYGSNVTFTASSTSSSAPTVATTAISAITSTTASSGGNVTLDGGASVTARGICWSTTANPTTANSKTSDGTGTGTFTSSITGLTASTTYNVRAYATNSVGTSYGSNISFTTAAVSTGTWNKIENTASGWVTNNANTYSAAKNSGGSTWSLWLANASVQYTFTGTQVRIYSYREQGMATGNIYIDDVLVGSNVAWSQSSRTYQQLVWTSATLSNASHTIKIVTTGDYIQVDYLSVLQGSAAATVSSMGLSSDVSTLDASVSLNAVSVYPNPANSFVNIDFGQNLGSGQARVEVLDMQGRRVYASGLISTESTLQLNTSEYSKGIYLIRISRGTESVTKKVMIE